jgi:sugar-phosphatase
MFTPAKRSITRRRGYNGTQNKGFQKRPCERKKGMREQFECEAILFDLDGVLVDSRRSVERVWRAWADRHDLDATQVVKIAHGRRALETVQLFTPHLNVEAESRRLDLAEIEDTAGIVKADGAADLLAALPPGSWAVVTSGSRALATARLRHTGLPIPQVLVGAEDVQEGKPDPECYLKGADLIGAAPQWCVVVEDTPAGVQAAWAAGMAAIAVTTTHRASELSNADAIVPTLANISLESSYTTQNGEPRLELLVEYRE